MNDKIKFTKHFWSHLIVYEIARMLEEKTTTNEIIGMICKKNYNLRLRQLDGI